MLEPALVIALNHLLDGASWANKRLTSHSGRVVKIELNPFLFSLKIVPPGRFESIAATNYADVRIVFSSAHLLHVFKGIDSLLATAHVEGNAELAQTLSFILPRLHWDYEEDLSRLVGDVAAHRASAVVASLFSAAQGSAIRFRDNVSEYLAHENPMLLHYSEYKQFQLEIEALHSRLSFLEKRLSESGRLTA